MRIRALVLALAAVLVLPDVSVAKPPSFALWSIRWDAHVSRDYTRLSERCEKASHGNDAKLGACVVKGEITALRAELMTGEKQVAAILRGQTLRCKNGIRAYRAAWRKERTALTAYLVTHRSTGMAQVFRDVRKEPLATLHRRTGDADAHAVRVCG